MTSPLTQILRRKTPLAGSLVRRCICIFNRSEREGGAEEEAEEEESVFGGAERSGEGKKPVALCVCSCSLPLTLVLPLPIRAEDEAGRDPSSCFVLGFFWFFSSLAVTHPAVCSHGGRNPPMNMLSAKVKSGVATSGSRLQRDARFHLKVQNAASVAQRAASAGAFVRILLFLRGVRGEGGRESDRRQPS